MTVHPTTIPAPRGHYQDWSKEITPDPNQPQAMGSMNSAAAADAGTRAVSGGNVVTGGTGGGSWLGAYPSTLSGSNAAASGDWTARQPSGVTGWSGNAPVPVPGSANVLRISNGQMGSIGQDIENNLPANEIGVPDSLEEVFRGSMKALLLRNIGNYVVATFLIGTQGTVSWEGILYDVGNDYVAIYQTGRDQYIVSDLYSLKYVEFYDTRRRQMCEALLSQQESRQ